jgi:hypothetical protein
MHGASPQTYALFLLYVAAYAAHPRARAFLLRSLLPPVDYRRVFGCPHAAAAPALLHDTLPGLTSAAARHLPVPHAHAASQLEVAVDLPRGPPGVGLSEALSHRLSTRRASMRAQGIAAAAASRARALQAARGRVARKGLARAVAAALWGPMRGLGPEQPPAPPLAVGPPSFDHVMHRAAREAVYGSVHQQQQQQQPPLPQPQPQPQPWYASQQQQLQLQQQQQQQQRMAEAERERAWRQREEEARRQQVAAVEQQRQQLHMQQQQMWQQHQQQMQMQQQQ